MQHIVLHALEGLLRPTVGQLMARDSYELTAKMRPYVDKKIRLSHHYSVNSIENNSLLASHFHSIDCHIDAFHVLNSASWSHPTADTLLISGEDYIADVTRWQIKALELYKPLRNGVLRNIGIRNRSCFPLTITLYSSASPTIITRGPLIMHLHCENYWDKHTYDFASVSATSLKIVLYGTVPMPGSDMLAAGPSIIRFLSLPDAMPVEIEKHGAIEIQH